MPPRPHFLYETRHARPLQRPQFYRRLANHLLVAALLLLLSLALGMAGYEHYEHLEWHDAFLNACMLLGGMGPVNNPASDPGKLFAGFFALYAGLLFIVLSSIVLAPILHRMLHLFHADERDR